jgi:hypothetical protein
MWPGLFNLWNLWIPAKDRGGIIGFVGSGSQVGIIFGFSLGKLGLLN